MFWAMNPCHAAALTLLGWYLMVPPWGRVTAPLSEWQIYEPLESAGECETARNEAIELQDKNKGQALSWKTASGGNLQFDLAAATCVGSDDPRLKEK